jgi:hypothetical protein
VDEVSGVGRADHGGVKDGNMVASVQKKDKPSCMAEQ